MVASSYSLPLRFTYSVTTWISSWAAISCVIEDTESVMILIMNPPIGSAA